MAFADRIAPHVRVGVRNSRMLDNSWRAEAGYSARGQLAVPVLLQIRRLASVHSPSTETLRKRLDAAGLDISVLDFRSQEIVHDLSGLVAGSALMAFAAVKYRVSIVLSVLILIGFGIVG